MYDNAEIFIKKFEALENQISEKLNKKTNTNNPEVDSNTEQKVKKSETYSIFMGCYSEGEPWIISSTNEIQLLSKMFKSRIDILRNKLSQATAGMKGSQKKLKEFQKEICSLSNQFAQSIILQYYSAIKYIKAQSVN